MVKLVATDMNGTFLTNNGYFDSKRLHDILEKFEKDNMLFIAASGRLLMALERMFAEHADRMAFITKNGTLVKVGENIVSGSGLSEKQYLEVIDTLLESPYMLGYDFLLSGENGAYLHPKVSDDYLNFISNYYENVQRVADLAQVEDNILKITANFSEGAVRQSEAWSNDRINYAQAVTTGFKSVDVVIRDVNRRTGLGAPCQAFNMDKSEIAAFGDNLNDFEMLDFAGTAVATESARQEVKGISNEIIGHYDEESVMAYMEGLVE